MNRIRIFTAATLLCLIAAAFTACKGEYEVPTYQVEAEETYTEFVTYPSLEEMSPAEMTKEAPMQLPLTFDASRVRLYKAISAEQSYMPDTYAQEIYENVHDQYFVFSDKMAFVVLTDGSTEQDRTYFYSAYYNEDGRLFYIGDDTYSWYYDENGAINILAYSYYFEGKEVGVTFYDPDGKRIGSISNGLYYDADFNVLDPAGQISFLQRLGPVAEVFKNDN